MHTTASSVATLGLVLAAAMGIAHAGNEQRCVELGAACVCSEPLQATSAAGYTTLFGYDFNPNDTVAGTDKECTKATSAAPGSVLEDGDGFRYVIETAGAMFDALPSDHAAGLVLLRTKDNTEGNPAGGGMFIGVDVPADTPVEQMAFRGYKYFSSGYELYRPTTCENSAKLLQFGKDATLSFIVSGSGGNYDDYGWIGTSIDGLRCCTHGPGGEEARGTYDEGVINGKWWRYEAVFTNVDTSGPAMTWKVYAKNITDGTPEVVIIDSTVPTPQPGSATSGCTEPNCNDDWTSAIATSVKSTSVRLSQMYFNLFRRDACNGYVGLTHVMAAAWNTIDPSHRIGPAIEIEGEGTIDLLPPAAPTGLTVQGRALSR